MAKRHHYYEIYCERGRTLECSNDNFSLCLKVPTGQKCPTCEEVEKFLGKKRLTIEGVRYHVVGLLSDLEGGFSRKDFTDENIFLFPECKYYLLDFAPAHSSDFMEIYEVTEKEFFWSIRFNYTIAKLNGDKVPSIRKTIKEIKESLNYETDSINAMGYLKLTTKNPAQWGYWNEGEKI